MTRQRHPARVQDDRPTPARMKLAAAWASVMFLYVYADILSLYKPGVIDDIQAGVVSTFQISQTWALGALTLMSMPVLMIVLSLTLPPRANRWTNLTLAAVYVPVSIANAVGESWTYFFTVAAGLEVAVLVAILWWAWTWPKAVSAETREQIDTHQPRHTIDA